jgi:hypothetical protein
MDDTGPYPFTAGRPVWSLLLVAALDARLLQKLAVLLLGHPLAALLDDRAHGTSLGVSGDVQETGVPLESESR